MPSHRLGLVHIIQRDNPIDLVFDWEEMDVIIQLAPGHVQGHKLDSWTLRRCRAVPKELRSGIPPAIEAAEAGSSQQNDGTEGMNPDRAVKFHLPRYTDRPLLPNRPRPRDGVSARNGTISDVTAPEFDRYIKTSRRGLRDEDLEFLYDTYHNILYEDVDMAHPTDLNAAGSPLPESFDDPFVSVESALKQIRHCHNGLHSYRHGIPPAAVHIHNLLVRLLFWDSMCTGHLGDDISTNPFYIVKPYRVVLRPDRPNKTAANRFESTHTANDGHTSREHAHYINTRPWMVMFAQFGEPESPTELWTVLIRHNKTRNVWYFDCGEHNTRHERMEQALRELDVWLNQIGAGRVGPCAMYPDIPAIDKDHMHLSSLHCMANVLVFLHYGVIGWDEVAQFKHANSKKMEEAMLSSLHGIMGLEYRGTPSLLKRATSVFKRHKDT